MSNAIEQYINNVKKELYHLVPSEDYISDLRTILEEYIQQFPESTYQNLVEQFGSPEDVAAEYINSQKPNVPKELARQRIKIYLFTGLAIAIIIFLISFIMVLSKSRQAFYTDVIIETEEEVISE